MLKLLNFDAILKRASDYVTSLPASQQHALKEKLDHGQALLHDTEELKAYLHYYGEIHRHKLTIAYSNILKTLSNRHISVIDWGCGQAIASLVLKDFVDTHPSLGIEITDITLIEPSKTAIQQALSYLAWSIPKALVSTMAIPEDSIDANDILMQEDTIVHLLSNIVDMPEFTGNGIVRYIKSNTRNRHIIICVSPFYPEEGRGKRMDEFGKRLTYFKQIYSFEKHIDDWDKNFSCQIRIFCNY